jgi:hypothetical protein
LAICISDSVPSIIRAPPEQLTTTSGIRRESASSAPSVIFSPTTTPMLPPMKLYSIAAMTSGRLSIVPVPTMMASFRPVERIAAASRSR